MPEEVKGQIKILEEGGRKGYRYSEGGEYYEWAFIDVYWQKVSDHYLIEKRERHHQNVRRFPLKDIFGPFHVEILEPETNEEAVDQRCLEILKRELKIKGLDKTLEISATNLTS